MKYSSRRMHVPWTCWRGRGSGRAGTPHISGESFCSHTSSERRQSPM